MAKLLADLDKPGQIFRAFGSIDGLVARLSGTLLNFETLFLEQTFKMKIYDIYNGKAWADLGLTGNAHAEKIFCKLFENPYPPKKDFTNLLTAAIEKKIELSASGQQIDLSMPNLSWVVDALDAGNSTCDVWQRQCQGLFCFYGNVLYRTLVWVERKMDKRDLIDMMIAMLTRKEAVYLPMLSQGTSRTGVLDTEVFGKFHKYISEMSTDMPLPLPILWDLVHGQVDSLDIDQWTKYNVSSIEEAQMAQIVNNMSVDKFADMAFQPSAHFKPDNLRPYIPFCTWGKGYTREGNITMESCQLFKQIFSTPSWQGCATFGYDPDNLTFVSSIGQRGGLTLFLDSYFGLTKSGVDKTFHLIVHEPGVPPDFLEIWNPVNSIPRGQYVPIELAVMKSETTDNFNAMDLGQRKCGLDTDNLSIMSGQKYSLVGCLAERKTLMAIDSCQCKPWTLNSNAMFKDFPVCDMVKLSCFNSIMDNKTMDKIIVDNHCPDPCQYVKYMARVATQTELTSHQHFGQFSLGYVFNNLTVPGLPDNWDNHGKLFKSYITDNTGQFVKLSFEEMVKRRQGKLTVVSINFADPKATVMTKDARVTFADKLGQIGGTCGIFLGLSFVGLWDLFSTVIDRLYKNKQ